MEDRKPTLVLAAALFALAACGNSNNGGGDTAADTGTGDDTMGADSAVDSTMDDADTGVIVIDLCDGDDAPADAGNCDPIAGTGCDCFMYMGRPGTCDIAGAFTPMAYGYCTIGRTGGGDGANCGSIACNAHYLCGTMSMTGFAQANPNGQCRLLCGNPGTTMGCGAGYRCVVLDGQTRYGACVPM